ncbi:DUF4097 family beta strand repeat-containing protein [Brevibacillus sp. NRS-1366]|uniref:DUF4097 family beta strand repeat-containing protein n=1 Tax=Brevibacillus sp. NRS-1366 TaxID=3233899 RepID=UPI003D242F16
MKHWGKKIFGISLLLFVLGASGLVWLFSKQEYFSFSLAQIDEQRTIQETFTSLNLTTDTADVVVTPSQLPTASVRLLGEANENQKESLQFVTEVTPDGTLKVEVQEKLHINLFFPVNGRLQIQVLLPEKTYEKIVVQTATGDIKTGILTAKEAKISSSTGDVELDGFTGEKLDIRTDTGDMKLAGVRSALEINSSTGEIDSLVLPELAHDVSIRTDTGDVRVKAEKQPTAAKLELSTDTGSIKTSWSPLSYEEKEEHQVKASVGTGGPTLTVESSTGDIRIQ